MNTPTVAVRERPILFSGPMVRAILDGRKTQTRRVVKPQPPPVDAVRARTGSDYGLFRDRDGPFRIAGPVGVVCDMMGVRNGYQWACHYGAPGDRLWVRETAWYDREVIPVLGYRRAFFEGGDVRAQNARDGRTDRAPGLPENHTAELFALNGSLVRRPSTHMPRWASRITLEVTEVRVERVQAITAADCIAEGIASRGMDSNGPNIASALMYIEDYKTLWDSLNATRGYGWDVNPWVWAVSFARVTP
jgi:hypothetical protein